MFDVQEGKAVWSAAQLKQRLSGARCPSSTDSTSDSRQPQQGALAWYHFPRTPWRLRPDVLPYLLQPLAAGYFTLVEEKEVPFVIREHRRKFQWGVSHATVWRRN
jgi:hypothetical protein